MRNQTDFLLIFPLPDCQRASPIPMPDDDDGSLVVIPCPQQNWLHREKQSDISSELLLEISSLVVIPRPQLLASRTGYTGRNNLNLNGNSFQHGESSNLGAFSNTGWVEFWI